jgi:hypothetical protein
MVRFFLFLVLFAWPSLVDAQLIFGWSAGYANPKEINRAIHVYNSVHSQTLSKEMQPVHFNHGLVAGYRIGSDGFVELLYTRKVATVSAQADSAGVLLERQLKVLSNTWNFGGGVALDSRLRIGLSVDVGRFKGRGRRGPESTIGDQEFQKLWVLDDTRLLGISAYKLYMASTVFAEMDFGLIGLRVYYQFAFLRNQMERLDSWLLSGQTLNWGTYLDDKFSNAGVMLTLQLGKR